MRAPPAREPERGVRRVVGGGLVLLAALVPSVGNVRRPQAAHGLYFAEEIVKHITPVTQHVEDDAAAVLPAVIPRRALRGLAVALEHPVAELAAHRQQPAEKSRVAQLLQLD